MKITITAGPGEQAKVEEALEALHKARHRHPDESIELLVPALRDAHDAGRAHRDRIERVMMRRIQEVIAE